MTNVALRGRVALLAAIVAAGLNAGPARSQSLVDKAQRDEIARVAEDDPIMARAWTRACETLPGFLDVASHPPPGTDGFSVKVAIREGDVAEYFWITPFSRSGTRFSGRLDNQPRTVHGVALGQTISFLQTEIVDWMYMDGKRMMGNYTARALLQKASPAERAEFKQRYGLDADF